jgi:hypothetical protein
MPTGSNAAAVLAVSDTIWDYGAWRERTKNVLVPLNPDATPDQLGLSQRELESIRVLAERFFDISGYGERIIDFAKKHDNDSAGKAAWSKWVNKRILSWKIRKDMETVLDEYERHPRSLLHKAGSVSGQRRTVVHEELTG